MSGAKGQDGLGRLERLAEETIAGIAQLRESQAKTDEQLNRTAEQILALKESQVITDQQLTETIKKLDDIGRQLEDLGLVQGEVAEDLFFQNLRGVFREVELPS